MLYGVIGVIILLVVIWIWVNVQMVKSSKAKPSEERQRVTSDAMGQAPPSPVPQKPSSPGAQKPSSPEAQGPSSDELHSSYARTDHPSVTESKDETGGPTHVEVVETPVGKRRLFDRLDRPYVLNDVSVPALADEHWDQCFTALVKEKGVLGWMAFQGETLGASDHDYDEEFMEVLRQYRRSVMKLRKEIGITEISESSIVGKEGQVWVIAAVDDIWLALFIDRQGDVETLTGRVLKEIRAASL